MYMEFV